MFGTALLDALASLALVSTRLAGFVIVSPFPGPTTPRSTRVGLVLLLSWFVASTEVSPVQGLSLELGVPLLAAVPGELAIGVLVALAFRTVMGAAEIGGELVSQAAGLGSASLFNPTTQGQETPVARLLWIVGAGLMISTGTHRVALGYLLETFHAIPMGSGIDVGAAAPPLLDLVASSLLTGLRLALPVIAVGFVAQVALALIARTAPALGVFQIGLPVLIAAGLVVLGLSLPTLVGILSGALATVPVAIERLLTAAAR